MKLFLPEVEFLERIMLSESQIRDLMLLKDKLNTESEYFHVFLLGGTGSGKSSLLNCLARQSIAEVGIQRPTTSELTLYGGVEGFTIPDVNFKAFSSRHESILNLKSLILWDFPDFDSIDTTNHSWSYLLKHYADCVFFVVHPEKTKQESLQNIISEYPEIPSVLILTHEGQLTSDELFQIRQDLSLTYSKVLSVDSLEKPEETRSEILNYLEGISKQGYQKYKENNLKNLSTHCGESLRLISVSLEQRISSATEVLSQLDEFSRNLTAINGPELFQVFDEKVFLEFRNQLLRRLYKTTPGWSVLVVEWISNFRAEKMGKGSKAVAYQSLQFYAAQEKCKALRSGDFLLNRFRVDHLAIIENCQRRSLQISQQFSLIHWIYAFLLEIVIPAYFCYVLVINFSPGTLYLGSSIFVVLLVILMSFLIGFLRLRYRLRGIYKRGLQSYQDQVNGWFSKIFESQIGRLEKQIKKEKQSYDSIRVVLQLNQGCS